MVVRHLDFVGFGMFDVEGMSNRRKKWPGVFVPGTNERPDIRGAGPVENTDGIIGCLTAAADSGSDSCTRRATSVDGAVFGSGDDGFFRRSNCSSRGIGVFVTGTDYPDGAHEEKEYGGDGNEFFHENVR